MSADGDAVADQVLPELALNDRNHVGGEGDIDDAPTAGANKVIVNVRPYVEDDVATIAGPDADFTTLEQSRRDAMHGCQRHPWHHLGKRTVEVEVRGVSHRAKVREDRIALNCYCHIRKLQCGISIR